ncbi:MAG TPA: hypothetical protein VKX45_24615 [Bryobacteraceae bacterium]|jgi:hypothetical protein|nr:hypothetical protein [Bryobacteraceae bacterium]
MKIFAGLCVFVMVAAGSFAQNRAGFVSPGYPTVRSFPSVVFPGGSSALPGVQRTTGSVVYPGGGTPQIGVPGIRLNNPPVNVAPPFGQGGNNRVSGFNGNGNWGNWGNGNWGNGNWGGGNWGFNGRGRGFKNGFNNNGFNNGTVVYAYPYPVPVYGGDAGYGADPSAVAAAAAAGAASAAVPQGPSTIVVINPQGAPVPPAMMMGMPPQGPAPASAEPASADTGETATHYLIAFKDHSIYSAVAYWVEGDTLHYFTTGNTHNQVSLSLVDRDLTRQLNAQSGLQLNLPAAQ